MRSIDLARQLAEAGQKDDAQKGYFLALQNKEELDPKEELEAASYLFFSKWDYKLPFTIFISLYNRGFFQAELMDLMLQAFYLPNVQKQQKQYGRNCRALARYPYFFRDGFLDFEALPILFFPFDDDGYIPFFKAENRFGDYINFDDPVIDRYFFGDLENPILAQDVYSQYQLEYLNDSVRRSEWVGRENHIYLHYTDWTRFCGYLPCLDFTGLLKEKKLVFLVEDEISQYPIDFKARFGIDYSQYPVKPVGIREVNKLIWHTQLSAHNGGDFFNEIFYGHPNLLSYESIMLDDYRDIIHQARDIYKKNPMGTEANRQLAQLTNPTPKDLLVAVFLNTAEMSSGLDRTSRIAPALFFQPHFSNMVYELDVAEGEKACALSSKQYEEIKKSPIFKGFKYIKTFTPIRRPTTSYAATVRFMVGGIDSTERKQIVPDAMMQRVLNRSYLRKPGDRLYRDSVLVRFEDGKLNPKATFTRLAEFLDIPYAESLTYCSSRLGLNPESLAGNVRGFDPATVYRTYDEYANDEERAFLEYFMRDIYEACGYDFQYYKGEPVDLAWAEDKISRFSTINKWIAHSMRERFQAERKKGERKGGEEKDETDIRLQLDFYQHNRLRIASLLLNNPRFITHKGQPLQMIPVLQLDPALLEQPLYR